MHRLISPPVIEAAVADLSARLNLAILAGVPGMLMWYSDKDLLAGIRNWVAANPDEALKILPEWDALRNLLRSYP